MKKFFTLTFLVWVANATVYADVARKNTLKLVQVIFRHGDRAPTHTYPTDPYNADFEKHWPDGMAQLTSRGKMQQYELGKFLRRRYDGFLGKTYSQKELYTLCSDMDRTIMSLESNLAGLFPPVNPLKPQVFKHWQPIPFRTIPRKEDKFLHNSVKCPRYSELRQEFLTSSQVAQKLNNDNAKFIEYCAENSGLPARTVKQLYPLLDVLYAQASHNFTLPNWVTEGKVLPKLLELYSIVNTWPTYTDEMKRLWGGNLLNLLLKNMRAITGYSGNHLGMASKVGDVHSISKHGAQRKLLMYSAHDSTLSRIMNTMGIFDPHCPPYASAVIIELHQHPESFEHFVEFHYRNDTSRAPFHLKNEKCGHPCKLTDLIDIYNHLIPVNWEKECHLESNFGSILKMSGQDNEAYESDEEGEENKDDLDWDKPLSPSPCSPSALQLLLMGIGLLVAAALVALLIIKTCDRRNANFYDIDGYNRPLLGRSSGYQKI